MKALINKEVELRIDYDERNDYISIPCKIVSYYLDNCRFESGGWNETMCFRLNLEPLDMKVLDSVTIFNHDFCGVSLDDIYKL
jgi:hypothetical protein